MCREDAVGGTKPAAVHLAVNQFGAARQHRAHGHRTRSRGPHPHRDASRLRTWAGHIIARALPPGAPCGWRSDSILVLCCSGTGHHRAVPVIGADMAGRRPELSSRKGSNIQTGQDRGRLLNNSAFARASRTSGRAWANGSGSTASPRNAFHRTETRVSGTSAATTCSVSCSSPPLRCATSSSLRPVTPTARGAAGRGLLLGAPQHCFRLPIAHASHAVPPATVVPAGHEPLQHPRLLRLQPRAERMTRGRNPGRDQNEPLYSDFRMHNAPLAPHDLCPSVTYGWEPPQLCPEELEHGEEHGEIDTPARHTRPMSRGTSTEQGCAEPPHRPRAEDSEASFRPGSGEDLGSVCDVEAQRRVRPHGAWHGLQLPADLHAMGATASRARAWLALRLAIGRRSKPLPLGPRVARSAGKISHDQIELA